MLAAALVARAADVTLTIEVDREKAPEGDSLRYIVDLTNAGDSATEQLSVNIGVPEDKLDVVSAATYAYTASWDWDTWVWKVLPLEPGKTARLSLTANVLTVETGEAVTVTASIPDGPADSASFTGIGEYRIESGTTIITGSVNLDDVPTYSSLIIEATGTVTGGVSYGREVRNAGTITGGTLNGSVDNKGGTITGGTFYDNVNNESGTITGGTFYGSVDNEGGTITGGTFNGNLSNDNGGRVQGQDANVPTINGAIENESGSSILQPCNFGGNARVRSNTGAIQVTMFVNGEAKAFNYGANILETLGGGTWCLLNEDSFSVCGANDTFGLQTRSYGKLSAPSVTLDYETESITVTVPDYLAGLTAEDEVYLGFPLDILTTWEEWNDVFASSGSYTSTLSRINSINEMFTGNPLPRDAGDGDVEIPVFFGSGTVVSDAYPGAVTTLVVPERPECGRVEPLALITGVDRLGIDATLRDTYDFGIAPAGDPAPDEPTILDEDGDGLITGLNNGEEYIVYLRLKATDSSFRSAWQEQGTATTVKTYTVTYTDGVDGAEVFADQVTGNLTVGEATPAFSGTPEREGYVFAGWNPAVAAAVSGDATYTATWKVDRNGNGVADEEEPKYTVTYTDGVDGEEIFADQVTSDLLVGEATPAFSGTPERQGYIFAGWNPTVAAAVDGNATYAAVWQPDRNGNGVADEEEQKYTVTYTDGVDGDEVFADQVTSDLLEGDATPAFSGTPEREGYMFTGWDPTVAATVSGDATYTAIWQPDRNGNGVADEEEPKYTVTYTDGVDGEEIFADQVTSDLLVGEATPAFSGTPERKGYVFAGWNPAVAATVSGDATYAATWEKIADERDSDDPAEIARKLAAGEAVEGLVTDRFGAAKPYEPLTMRTLDEESGEEQKRTLIIAADPVRDEDGEIVARDGEPVYEQRNLHLSQSLLNALAELNYTHIRFAVKDAALEWAIADMREDGNVIRLAPMEQDELTQAEREAIGEAELLSDAYRARITAMVDGEETDITAEIPSLTAWFDAETVRQLAEGETAQCLLAPGDGEPEKVASEAVYVEEGEEAKEISYQAALAESGLFGLALQ